MGDEREVPDWRQGPFWRPAELAPDLLSDGPVTMTWDGTDGQPGGGAAMVAFSGGPPPISAASGGAQRDRELPCRARKGLSRHPGELRERTASWTGRRDPWTKASYSFPAPGQVTAQGPTLRQGIGRLHFAGEYTSYAFMGYMEGALNSGAAVAAPHRPARRRRQSRRGMKRRGRATDDRARSPADRRVFVTRDRGSGSRRRRRGSASDRADRRIDAELTPAQAPPAREGFAAAILIDVSGSMTIVAPARTAGTAQDRHRATRRPRPGRPVRAVRRRTPGEPVLLGMYEFSERNGEPDRRPIMPMGPPDRARAEAAIARCDAERRHADWRRDDRRQARARRHRPHPPPSAGRHRRREHERPRAGRVAAAIGRRPEAERPSIYFVAFDIAASRFAGVRDAGGLVLAAANARS